MDALNFVIEPRTVITSPHLPPCSFSVKLLYGPHWQSISRLDTPNGTFSIARSPQTPILNTSN